jgi:hypothetical protein
VRRRYRPFVFTEQGVAMLCSVLRSQRAVQVQLAIMRAFVQLRRLAVSNEEFRKIESSEKRYGARFHAVFATNKANARSAYSAQETNRLSRSCSIVATIQLKVDQL